jgi:hypothetical protein
MYIAYLILVFAQMHNSLSHRLQVLKTEWTWYMINDYIIIIMLYWLRFSIFCVVPWPGNSIKSGFKSFFSVLLNYILCLSVRVFTNTLPFIINIHYIKCITNLQSTAIRRNRYTHHISFAASTNHESFPLLCSCVCLRDRVQLHCKSKITYIPSSISYINA